MKISPSEYFILIISLVPVCAIITLKVFSVFNIPNKLIRIFKENIENFDSHKINIASGGFISGFLSLYFSLFIVIFITAFLKSGEIGMMIIFLPLFLIMSLLMFAFLNVRGTLVINKAKLNNPVFYLKLTDQTRMLMNKAKNFYKKK